MNYDQNCLVEYRGNHIHHIGSTAIIDMYGKPMMDMMILTQGILPNIPKNLEEKLNHLGFQYWGPAPHAQNKQIDQWFRLIFDEQTQKQNNGVLGTTLHIVNINQPKAKNSVDFFIDFRDYCNSNPNARLRYRQAKENAKGNNQSKNNSILVYSISKQRILHQIRKESIIWAESLKNQ